MTARKEHELAEQQRQTAILEQQASMLAELSTPLLTINETTVVMPLVGAVDTGRVQQIKDTLLAGVAASGASKVIPDITGVPVSILTILRWPTAKSRVSMQTFRPAVSSWGSSQLCTQDRSVWL